jgi:hypothetical protein
MVHMRRTTQIGVARPPSPSASQRLPGGRDVRSPAASQRVPRGGGTGSTSRRVASPRDTRSTRTRPVPDLDAQKKKVVVAGGVIGVLVVILLGAFAFGGSKPLPKPKAAPAPVPRTMDAAGHAREASVVGEDGIRKAREAVARYERTRDSLKESDRTGIVEQLEEANSDLESALAHVEKAASMTGPGQSLGVDEKRFIEMKKEVRRHLLELKR